MGIEKIKGNVDVAPSLRQNNKKFVGNRVYMGAIQDSTSFTGAGSAAAGAVKPLKDFLLDIMPKSIKTMVNIHEGMGEVQNQLINAVGTGLVAPLFIKYNPISDTDKDTRTYTAWRQPVSAVLAVGTQAAIVVPFNSLIKRLADIGYLSTRYNSTLFPSDDYVKKLVKAENPDAAHYSKKEMKAAIEAYNKKNISPRLISMIEKDHIVFDTTDGINASTFEMPKEEFKKLFEESIDGIIKSERIERDKVISQKLPKKIARAQFFHSYPKESRELLNKLLTELKQLTPQSDLDALPQEVEDANKKFNSACKELIKSVKKDESNREIRDELIKIIKEVKDKNNGSGSSTLRVVRSKVEKMIESVNIIESKRSTKEIMDYVNEVIFRRTGAIDGTINVLSDIKARILSEEGLTVKRAQQIVDEAIRASEAEVRELLRPRNITDEDFKNSIEYIDSVGTRLKTKVKSVAGCIADTLKQTAKSNIDGFKRWTGLGVSLAILPVTCWLLNRIYPWFMDKAFPELSNKAASAKGKKNQKAEEVK
ncbi:hypothetical protein IJ541_04120 [bacterium]|nr:hypothetical protein [bacterium]